MPYHRHNSICFCRKFSIKHSPFPQVFRQPITFLLGISLPFLRSQEPVHRHLLQHFFFVGTKKLTKIFNQTFAIQPVSLEPITYICTETLILLPINPLPRTCLSSSPPKFLWRNLLIATKKRQQNSQWNVCHSTENPLLHLHKNLGRAFVTDWVITLKYLFGTVIWSFTNYFQ